MVSITLLMFCIYLTGCDQRVSKSDAESVLENSDTKWSKPGPWGGNFGTSAHV
jgi:hypothetical protein